MEHQTSETRRRTLVAVGKINRSVRTLETLLERFAATPGPQQSVSSGVVAVSSRATGAGDGGFFCEGRR